MPEINDADRSAFLTAIRDLPDDLLDIGVAAYDRGGAPAHSGDALHMTGYHCLSEAWRAIIDALLARHAGTVVQAPANAADLTRILREQVVAAGGYENWYEQHPLHPLQPRDIRLIAADDRVGEYPGLLRALGYGPPEYRRIA